MIGLLEFIASLLEFIVGLADLVAWWRFFACLLLSLTLVALIYRLIPNQDACLALSIPTVLVGLVIGVIWQRRNR